jgi:hypothetical protein
MGWPLPTVASADASGCPLRGAMGSRELTSRTAIALSLSSIIVAGVTPVANPQDKHSGTARS